MIIIPLGQEIECRGCPMIIIPGRQEAERSCSIIASARTYSFVYDFWNDAIGFTGWIVEAIKGSITLDFSVAKGTDPVR